MRGLSLKTYFAYGSNLHHDDWSAFCREHSFDPQALRPIGPATLADEALVFDYYSRRRQGGALNIRSQPGGAVDGYLFAVSANGWVALDLKEGHPHRYRRETVRVRDLAKRTIAAQTYRVTPEHRCGFTRPMDDYLAICRQGRLRYGLSVTSLDTAAAGLI